MNHKGSADVPQLVSLTIVLQEHDPAAIEQIAETVSNPKSPEYGRYPPRDEFRSLVMLPPHELKAVVDWVQSQGMRVIEASGTNPQLLFVQATRTQLINAFGTGLERWLEKDPEIRTSGLRLRLPKDIAGYIQKVGGIPGERGQFGAVYVPDFGGADSNVRAIPTKLPAGVPMDRSASAPPPGLAGVTPADIRDIYGFPPGWDGSGETVALLAFGGELDRGDLETFWHANGIAPPRVSTVHVGPSSGRATQLIETLEITMAVEWVGAMAPGASIVVYYVDPAVMGDPWSAFLFAVLGDETNSPTIASNSWVTPERHYYRLHGNEVFGGLLDQAAAAGITVISASGDWGAFDGVPRTIRDGRPVTDAPWPHGVFPSVEPRVLSVGGTMITSRKPLTEVGWSGALSPAVLQLLPLQLVASSGGFSEDNPVPTWQRSSLRGSYPRGAATPAVVPYGRGFPDVALMASGPSVQRGVGEPLTAQGYQAVVAGQWIDYAGGTSLAAPIWASIIALANQARRHAGLLRLGWPNPLLYQLSETESGAFREVTFGAADVAVNAVNLHGRAVTYQLPGYQCGPGWNPVTGLGVPNVAALIKSVCSVVPRS